MDGGIRTLMAAIGSSVNASISNSALLSAAISDSTTTRGKKVAIISTDAAISLLIN